MGALQRRQAAPGLRKKTEETRGEKPNIAPWGGLRKSPRGGWHKLRRGTALTIGEKKNWGGGGSRLERSEADNKDLELEG